MNLHVNQPGMCDVGPDRGAMLDAPVEAAVSDDDLDSVVSDNSSLYGQ